jgi:hypothetical protein
MQHYSEWVDTCSEIDPWSGSVNLTKESFYNRMRLEIGELVESLDFTVLREGSRHQARPSSHRPKFQLTSIDEFAKQTVPAPKKTLKRVKSAVLRPLSAKSVSTVKPSVLPPAVEPKPVAPKKKKMQWIRVEDIREIPEGVCITFNLS